MCMHALASKHGVLQSLCGSLRALRSGQADHKRVCRAGARAYACKHTCASAHTVDAFATHTHAHRTQEVRAGANARAAPEPAAIPRALMGLSAKGPDDAGEGEHLLGHLRAGPRADFVLQPVHERRRMRLDG